MKYASLFLICAVTVAMAQDKIVRVYANSWQELQRISPKYEFEVVSARADMWYDIIADQEIMNKIIGSGLNYEVTVHSILEQKERARASYLSYTEVNDSLRALATNYPDICALDSLPLTTYEGRWIYGLKISDDPHSEDDSEPGFFIDGCHHAREWASVPVIMFFVDSMIASYGVVPEITETINSTEIYCFPIINVDGYVYDFDNYNMWRKNREPFGGAIGTDPNRNYPGCSPDIEGDWGAVDEGKATHRPDYSTFCGAYANSGDETRSLVEYVKSHTCNAYMSYHSSGEIILWPWGWIGDPCPHATLHDQVGNHMADMVQSLYGGSYARGPIYATFYAVSGSSLDWFLSWNHWVNGISNLSYTTELGTMFYQPPDDLDHIVHENFDALFYLADFCDSIVLLADGVVPPAPINSLGTVPQDFTISWQPRNRDDNHPLSWELVELSSPSIIEDDLESGTERWLLNGFTLSQTYAHSGTHSFFSGSIDEMNHAVTTTHPYLVQPGDSVTFWCRYNLELRYDVAVIEVSENTKEWFNLDTTRFNGEQSTWARAAYSLEDWEGKSIYVRFRAMTDGGVLGDGFYVDDIAPVSLFGNVDTVSSSIADTFYQFANHDTGDYYYYVRGYNSGWGWGDYSRLEKAEVLGIEEKEELEAGSSVTTLSLYPNPFRNMMEIRYAIRDAGYGIENWSLEIYDVTGRVVRSFGSLPHAPGSMPVYWHGDDHNGQVVPAGVYFVRLSADDYSLVKKAILLK